MIITLLRKSLEGSVADNTLKHGCGAINIDATRVGTEVMTSIAMGSLGVMHDDGWKSKPIDPIESTGRWPANFILTHLEGCELVGTKKVKGSVGKDSEGNNAKTEISMNNSTGGVHRVSHADEDGKEEVADWACVEGCPVRGLDPQNEGASRFFMQFKKESENEP